MKVTLLGVRGTSPVTEERFRCFGGETTCVLIEGEGGEKVIIDAGTGIREAGELLSGREPGRVLILITHYHLDHVFGFPNFAPLMDPAWEIEVAAPIHNGHPVDEVFARLLAQPFWPVQVDQLGGKVSFYNLENSLPVAARRYGGLTISWAPLSHPGGCWAYRVDQVGGGSFLFATDMEWEKATPTQQEAFLKLARGDAPLNLLVLDGQYDRKEYQKKQGWGHNAWEDACALGQKVGAQRLLITHHDPQADDDALWKREAQMKKSYPWAEMARQGMELKPDLIKDGD